MALNRSRLGRNRRNSHLHRNGTFNWIVFFFHNSSWKSYDSNCIYGLVNRWIPKGWTSHPDLSSHRLMISRSGPGILGGENTWKFQVVPSFLWCLPPERRRPQCKRMGFVFCGPWCVYVCVCLCTVVPVCLVSAWHPPLCVLLFYLWDAVDINKRNLTFDRSSQLVS